MIKTAVAVAIALVAVSVAVTGHLAASTPSGMIAEVTPVEQSFITPRIDGRSVDVRYSLRMPADPAMTAERFCRSQGFDAVVGYTVQPASATRTIGDFEAQSGSFGLLQAFYAIRCTGATDLTEVAMR